VVARAREGGADRTITVCSPLAFNGSLLVRPHIGRGLAAVVMAKARGTAARDLSARPDVVWAAPGRGLDAVKTERNAALARAGYAAPTMSTNGALAMGRRASTAIDLGAAPAGCARIDVVAGAPLALVAAELWDDKGALLAAGEGASGATLFACARGKARLTLETRGRPGPYAVTVRPERWKDPAFAAHPLAAGRMLDRAAQGATMLIEGSTSSVRAVVLEAGKVQVWDESVAGGQCLLVAVGAEGEGTGIELRLLDSTNLDLDRSHGEHAAAVRTCAPSGVARPVRVELRTTSGKLSAVIGVRTP
jgi:hypothetical protein